MHEKNFGGKVKLHPKSLGRLYTVWETLIFILHYLNWLQQVSDIASECSVYEATSLLKDYLKQLPDGVLPDSSVDDWMEVLNTEESGSIDLTILSYGLQTGLWETLVQGDRILWHSTCIFLSIYPPSLEQFKDFYVLKICATLVLYARENRAVLLAQKMHLAVSKMLVKLTPKCIDCTNLHYGNVLIYIYMYKIPKLSHI